MSDATDIFSVMTVHALDVSTATAEQVALERWGIAGRAKALTGERDRNFHFLADDGREFVLKFANPVEDAAVTEMQVQALQHIARVDPDLPVPRVMALPDGGFETPVAHETGGIQRVRLLSWLPGTNLHHSRRSAAQRVACGELLARVQLALADFHHRADHHELVWDLKHADRMREVTFAVPAAHARARIGEVFDEFRARVSPMLPALRHQVVHNDMNGLNTLVDSDDHDRLAGLIDFGDMVDTPVVIDVATGSVSQFAPGTGVGVALAEFAGAFHARRRLLPEEIELLALLSATRVAISLSLQCWHRHVQPENPHYAPVTDADIARRLGHIETLLTAETEVAVRRACAR
jgi:Ser/Thr protein kinase RdoA (MazF antagonist)